MSVPPRLLEVENLRTYFHTDGAVARAVDGVSFTVGAGETLAIVGESGSGKSVTSLSIMRLIPTPPGEIADGVVRFRGRDLLLLSEPAMRAVRGNEIGMIFQEPMSSLNPLLTVGEQIAEVVRLHQKRAALQVEIESLTATLSPFEQGELERLVSHA
jgi:peptide/nickel transport system ATP-binding protein/oligopeptide transport system ATP-binding protein